MDSFFATKSDLAYDAVRRRILTGELAPGAAINQSTLADEIGMSTTPLREALRRLKSERLIHLDAHRDATVAELSAEEARDLHEVRQSMDPLAAELAAERRTDEDIAQMRATAEALQPIIEGSGPEVLAAHRRFHATVYRASHNEVLITLLDDLWDKADRYRLLGLHLIAGSGAQRLRDYEEHFAIMEAVIAGDARRAGTLLRRHVRASLQGLAMRALSDTPPPES
jgi:DNA-binding GntR family transcriptional regulator